MAYIVTEDHKAAAGPAPAGLITPEATTAQNIVISPMGMTEVPMPGQGFVTNAVMSQEGSDLVLESPDGITIIIEGYFAGDTPPDLVSPDGKVLTPALVKSFIQAGTDFAQDEQTAMADTTPVGAVGEVTGHATVTHMDGSKETIAKGTAIFEGDIIETDETGAVNIRFADDSSFAVSNSAKLAIDEFVFDSQTNEGENRFSMLRGLFVYTSGLVGREDPDDVQINTPVGSIGIRGTIITGMLPADGSDQPAQISVVEGAIVVSPVGGGPDITLSQQFETVRINTATGETTNIGVLPQTEMSQTFNVLRTVAPTLFSAMDEAQQESQQPAPDQAPVAPDAPADTAPRDSAPQDSAPQPLPADPMQLNLLPGHIGTDPLSETRLVQQAALGAEPVAVTTIQSLSPASAAPAPTPVIAAPIVDAAKTADGNASTGGAFTPSLPAPGAPNQRPTVLQTAFTADEQPGIEGGGHHSFDISRFFRDPENQPLSFTIENVTDPTGSISNSFIAGDSLVFEVNTAASFSSASAIFRVTATDGSGTSNPILITVNSYGYQGSTSGSAGIEYLDLSIANQRFSMLGEEDIVEFNAGASNNIVFGGNGGDMAYFYDGSGNKFFGEDGDDTISVTGGTNAYVSGGAGVDTFNFQIGNFTAFGGTGDDRFALNSTAANALFSNTSSKIDGGLGMDVLAFNTSNTINLALIDADHLKNIEVIRAMFTGTTTITLGASDVFQHGSNNSLWIDSDANDVVNLTGAGAGFTATGGTATYDGETYNVYTGGGATLYVNQVTATVIV